MEHGLRFILVNCRQRGKRPLGVAIPNRTNAYHVCLYLEIPLPHSTGTFKSSLSAVSCTTEGTKGWAEEKEVQRCPQTEVLHNVSAKVVKEKLNQKIWCCRPDVHVSSEWVEQVPKVFSSNRSGNFQAILSAQARVSINAMNRDHKEERLVFNKTADIYLGCVSFRSLWKAATELPFFISFYV